MNELKILQEILNENPASFPFYPTIKVLGVRTITRTRNWIKAISLIDSSRNKEPKYQLRLYGWQKNKKGEYKVRQKFNISQSAYVGLLIFVLNHFISSRSDFSRIKGGRELLNSLIRENKKLSDKLRFTSENLKTSSNIKKRETALKKLRGLLKNQEKGKVDEKKIQSRLKDNFWMLGGEYVAVIGEEWLAKGGRLDFLAEKTNTYYDIVELKLPSDKLFVGGKGKESMSAELKDAISQMARYRNYYDKNYLFEFAREEDSRRDVRYPIGKIIIGRGNKDQKLVLEYHRNIFDRRLDILTYDDVLEIAENVLSSSKGVKNKKKG